MLKNCRQDIGVIGDNPIHTPFDQTQHIGPLIDRPDVHREALGVGGLDETPANQPQKAGIFRDLEHLCLRVVKPVQENLAQQEKRARLCHAGCGGGMRAEPAEQS